MQIREFKLQIEKLAKLQEHGFEELCAQNIQPSQAALLSSKMIKEQLTQIKQQFLFKADSRQIIDLLSRLAQLALENVFNCKDAANAQLISRDVESLQQFFLTNKTLIVAQANAQHAGLKQTQRISNQIPELQTNSILQKYSKTAAFVQQGSGRLDELASSAREAQNLGAGLKNHLVSVNKNSVSLIQQFPPRDIELKQLQNEVVPPRLQARIEQLNKEEMKAAELQEIVAFQYAQMNQMKQQQENIDQYVVQKLQMFEQQQNSQLISLKTENAALKSQLESQVTSFTTRINEQQKIDAAQNDMIQTNFQLLLKQDQQLLFDFNQFKTEIARNRGDIDQIAAKQAQITANQERYEGAIINVGKVLFQQENANTQIELLNRKLEMYQNALKCSNEFQSQLTDQFAALNNRFNQLQQDTLKFTNESSLKAAKIEAKSLGTADLQIQFLHFQDQFRLLQEQSNSQQHLIRGLKLQQAQDNPNDEALQFDIESLREQNRIQNEKFCQLEGHVRSISMAQAQMPLKQAEEIKVADQVKDGGQNVPVVENQQRSKVAEAIIENQKEPVEVKEQAISEDQKEVVVAAMDTGLPDNQTAEPKILEILQNQQQVQSQDQPKENTDCQQKPEVKPEQQVQENTAELKPIEDNEQIGKSVVHLEKEGEPKELKAEQNQEAQQPGDQAQDQPAIESRRRHKKQSEQSEITSDPQIPEQAETTEVENGKRRKKHSKTSEDVEDTVQPISEPPKVESDFVNHVEQVEEQQKLAEQENPEKEKKHRKRRTKEDDQTQSEITVPPPEAEVQQEDQAQAEAEGGEGETKKKRRKRRSDGGPQNI